MELPLNTIVITILVLLCMAAVGIVFFSEAKANGDTMDIAQCAQMCVNTRAQIAAGSTLESAKTGFCKYSCDRKADCFVDPAAKIAC
jgi:hypothetical protein